MGAGQWLIIVCFSLQSVLARPGDIQAHQVQTEILLVLEKYEPSEWLCGATMWGTKKDCGALTPASK